VAFRTDPDLDYEYYDLTKDADHVLTGSSRPGKNSFDRIMYWSPDSNTVKDLKQQKRRIEESVRYCRRSQNIFNTLTTRTSHSYNEDRDSVCPTCGSALADEDSDSSLIKK
jgi:hypothetical protein